MKKLVRNLVDEAVGVANSLANPQQRYTNQNQPPPPGSQQYGYPQQQQNPYGYTQNAPYSQPGSVPYFPPPPNAQGPQPLPSYAPPGGHPAYAPPGQGQTPGYSNYGQPAAGYLAPAQGYQGGHAAPPQQYPNAPGSYQVHYGGPPAHVQTPTLPAHQYGGPPGQANTWPQQQQQQQQSQYYPPPQPAPQQSGVTSPAQQTPAKLATASAEQQGYFAPPPPPPGGPQNASSSHEGTVSQPPPPPFQQPSYAPPSGGPQNASPHQDTAPQPPPIPQHSYPGPAPAASQPPPIPQHSYPAPPLSATPQQGIHQQTPSQTAPQQPIYYTPPPVASQATGIQQTASQPQQQNHYTPPPAASHAQHDNVSQPPPPQQPIYYTPPPAAQGQTQETASQPPPQQNYYVPPPPPAQQPTSPQQAAPPQQETLAQPKPVKPLSNPFEQTLYGAPPPQASPPHVSSPPQGTASPKSSTNPFEQQGFHSAPPSQAPPQASPPHVSSPPQGTTSPPKSSTNPFEQQDFYGAPPPPGTQQTPSTPSQHAPPQHTASFSQATPAPASVASANPFEQQSYYTPPQSAPPQQTPGSSTNPFEQQNWTSPPPGPQLGSWETPQSTQNTGGYQNVPSQSYAPNQPPTSHDPLSHLANQMNNLHVQPSDAPRGPAPIRPSGPPDETLSGCTEDRQIDFAMDWYRLRDTPKFLICTRCYADHIRQTPLAGAFERVHQPDGSVSACLFWFPRVKDMLFPQAVQTNDLSALRSYMARRPDIPPCRGRVYSTGVDGGKWYGLAERGVIDGFIACEACYEDRVAGTPFEPRFSPFRKQGTEEKWMCDLCIPYLATAVGKMGKTGDWLGCLAAMKHRLELPTCEGKTLAAGTVKWFVPRRKIEGMRICEACYLDKLALSRFAHEFEPLGNKRSGLGGLLEELVQDGEASCDLAVISLVVALEAALWQRDVGVFLDAAQAVLPLVPCTANGIVRGKWWTVNRCDLSVCEACYHGILKTTAVAQYFQPIERDPTADIVCSFCPASHRFAAFMKRLAETLDKGVFSPFGDYVTLWAGVPACPGIRDHKDGTWWAYGEVLACQECWLGFVSETSLGPHVPVKGETDSRSLICQFWSPRIRRMWLETCNSGPPGSPASQAAVDEFKMFGIRRLEVYNATIPQIQFIEQMKVIKMQQAMHQGHLAIMYQGMDGMASLSGTTDGHLHGSSSLGWHATEYGATSAQMMNNMHTGMANANSADNVMQVVRLKMMWAKVE